jgi:predicted metal-dependent phosphoesterase TrpH
MIDLHVHTNFSDGADDFITVLKKAEKMKLKYLSITDHDNCLVYNEIKKINIQDYFKGVLIPGVELQANVLGFSIELLGYGVNTDKINNKIKEVYTPFEKLNLIELERLYKKCTENGMIFPKNILEKYKDSGYYYATEYLHSEMRKNIFNKQFVPDEESWERESVFFKRHTRIRKANFMLMRATCCLKLK